ncbi:MAG: preprotein translocase subunit SecG [Lentisphaerae bacterium]|jgi:preprotein translocase subunit SecG|nr:preprotein translocase subunit SecG [Lentisphaerota bacterium]
MLIFKALLIVVVVVCSCLLIAVILLQKSKGEGLGLAFGSQMGESLFGARASNVLVKITIWLGVAFMVATILLAMIYARGHKRAFIEHRASGQQSGPLSIPASPMPVVPDAPPPAPPLDLPSAPLP